MLSLTGLTATPSQTFQVPISGEFADITLNYRPAIQMWFIDISYKGIDINGIRVCNNINLLSQYNKLLKFGMYVEMDGAIEPGLIDDFSTGRALLNILDESEIELIESGYSILKQTG